MIIDYIKILSEYQADQRDGFVSNIDTYVDSKYSYLIPEYRDAIKKFLTKAPCQEFKEYICRN